MNQEKDPYRNKDIQPLEPEPVNFCKDCDYYVKIGHRHKCEKSNVKVNIFNGKYEIGSCRSVRGDKSFCKYWVPKTNTTRKKNHFRILNQENIKVHICKECDNCEIISVYTVGSIFNYKCKAKSEEIDHITGEQKPLFGSDDCFRIRVLSNIRSFSGSYTVSLSNKEIMECTGFAPKTKTKSNFFSWITGSFKGWFS